jgi:predicted permease
MSDVRLELNRSGSALNGSGSARGSQLIDDLIRDVRYAARQLRRSPGFAVAAILCLALGIGVTTAIYSVINAVLLQPLPFAYSDQLVRVSERVPPTPGRPMMQRGIPYQDILDWRQHARTLSDAFAVADIGQRLVRTSQGAAGLWGFTVSANAFTMLGVHAIMGRPFDASDAANPDVAVLTFETWQRHFNADPHVVGTTIELRAGSGQNPVPPRLLTVVGVLPADFALPIAGSDFYIPLRPPDASSGPSPRFGMIGRLAPGVSLTAAMDELSGLCATSRPPWPANTPALQGPRIELDRLKDLAVSDLKPALGLFLAAVVVVLLIACANVANLLLARGTARQREIAVRQAIGASRGRLVRQIMAECLVLAAAGGAAGALLGAAGVAMAKQLALVEAPGIFAQMFGSTILPRAHEVHVDLTVLGIAFSVAAITNVVFGLLPALYLSRTRQITTIGPGVQGGSPVASRTRELLVVAQLAMATILLVGAGLLIHSFVRLVTNNKGYDASHVVALQLLFPDQYLTARRAETVGTMLTRLRQLPGVRAAGFARHGILIGETIFVGTFVPPGRTLDEMQHQPSRPQVRSVSDGFLTAMRVPLLDGREFTAADDAGAPPVIVINRTAARNLFGSARAVGQSVDWYVGSTPVQARVIGVVEDVRQESLAQKTFPEIYVDYRQLLAALEPWPQFQRSQNALAMGFLSFAIRTDDDPASVMPTIQRLVGVVDPNVGIDALVPMTRLVSDSLARERFSTVLLGIFALAAGLLAAIGI